MKKLLIATTIPVTIRAFLLPFAKHFRDCGWQVDAMACGISEDVKTSQAFNKVWDINWSRNPLNPANMLRLPRQVKGIVRQEQYDIVHFHTPVASFVGRYALRNMRALGKPKIIYTAHGFHYMEAATGVKNQIYLMLEKIAGKWTDGLIVINAEDENAAKRHRIVPDNNIVYMPGIGIDTDYFNECCVDDRAAERIRADLGLESTTPLLLMIASFDPGKRHSDFLEAFSRIKNSNAQVAFAGTGNLLEYIQKMTDDLGLQKRVHFLGHRDDIRNLLKAATVVILPSEREGLPRSILEAMSMGKPVIGTNIRGIRDLLSSGAGILIQVGDIQGLTQAIDYILEHPEKAINMGRIGKEAVRINDIKDIIRMHERLYAI